MDEDDAYQQVNKMLDEIPDSGDSAEAVPSETPGEEIDMGMISNINSKYIKYGSHVAEVFSPPRVNVIAKKIGLSPGFSLDLNVNDPEDNRPWDFTLESKRNKALALVKSQKPFLLIGCPPCTAFSVLFSSNLSRMDPEQVKSRTEAAIKHIEFCIKLYKLQVSEGRYFLHEHPWSAWSWSLPCVQELLKYVRV